MAIPNSMTDREFGKFKESSGTAGQVGVVVVNADGSSVGSGGGSGASAAQVQGTAADNAVAVGNPVRIGGKYNSTKPTYDTGDVGDTQIDVRGNTFVTQGTAIDKTIDSILTFPRGSNYTSITASTLILTGAGKIRGLFVVAASSTPTIKVWDNTSAATTVLVDTFTPVAATYYNLNDARVGTGIYVTISGTVTVTVFYDPTTT